MFPATVDQAAREWLDERLDKIGKRVSADGMGMISPIAWGLEHRVRVAIDAIPKKRPALLVVLDTPGGVVEVVERIVRTFRTNYQEVKFLIVDRALSAGTILAMSGDAILMDYHSCLGPIDPQVERDGKLVPALSYLVQYHRLIDKSNKGTLSTAEAILLQKLDLAELHQFELARDLSTTLLKEWLTKYKFKDWTVTETTKTPVTPVMKEQRAAEIATALNDHQRWHTHGRGIDMKTLQDELKVKIDDYGTDTQLSALVWNYFWFLRDHMGRHGMTSFVHTRGYF
jgi:hypothetical protein